MKPKLLELAEILKQKPEIKERLERLEFGCYIYWDGEYTIFLSEEGIQMGGGYTGFRILRDFSHTQYIGKEGVQIIGHEPAYHDLLEYLGEDYFINKNMICENTKFYDDCLWEKVKLSPGPLSDQTGETLDEIISLCKNVGK